MPGKTRRRELRCACGADCFAVRIDSTEQVGLLSCTTAEHHSLLLDSRDYWGTVLQNGKPKAARCRCKGSSFRVTLDYHLRDSGSVQLVEVVLGCTNCDKSQRAATFEIDYEPTDALLARPLDPIEKPWLKAKQVSVTALWTPRDLARFVTHAAGRPGTFTYLERHGTAPERQDLPQVLRCVRQVGSPYYRIYFATEPQRFPDNTRDCWKEMPVVCTGSPTQMQYSSGLGFLYYVEYAEQVFEGAEVVAQPRAFLEYAAGLRAWLKESFISARGRDTADAPEEWQRLKAGIQR